MGGDHQRLGIELADLLQGVTQRIPAGEVELVKGLDTLPMRVFGVKLRCGDPAQKIPAEEYPRVDIVVHAGAAEMAERGGNELQHIIQLFTRAGA